MTQYRTLCKIVMYREFVVCNVPGSCITNAENSTIFYFKSVSTWQEEPTAHVRSAKGFMGYDKCPLKQRKEKLNLIKIQGNVLIGTSPKVENSKVY